MANVEKKDLSPPNDEARLAELGYRQELSRHFGLMETFGLALSLMTVIPGIASILFSSIPNGGPVAMIWGWLVAGVFMIFVSLAIAELGSAAPTVGGLYYWTHKYASPRCRNLLAWLTGYANTIYLIAGSSGSTWAVAVQVAACVNIGSDGQRVLTTGQVFGIFTGILIWEALIASLATRALARLQNLNIIANILLTIAFIIALAVATPNILRNSTHFVFTDFENFSGWSDGLAFCLSFTVPLWVIAGFDTAVHISEESQNATTTIPYAIVASTIYTFIVGFVINIVLAFFMGSDLLSIVTDPAGQPLAVILLNSLGKKGGLSMFTFVLLLLFLAAATVVIVASRQTFAFARDGALPGSGFIYHINTHTGTPVNAVCYVTFFAWLLGFIPFAGPQAVSAVFSLTIAAQYVAFVIPITSRYMFKNDFKPGPFTLGRFGLPNAVLSVLWMVFMFVIFMFPVSPGPNTNTMNYSVVVLGGWFVISLVWYYFPVYGGVYWFRGPIPNINADDEVVEVCMKHGSSGSAEGEKCN